VPDFEGCLRREVECFKRIHERRALVVELSADA
jgi:hypothetical protein